MNKKRGRRWAQARYAKHGEITQSLISQSVRHILHQILSAYAVRCPETKKSSEYLPFFPFWYCHLSLIFYISFSLILYMTGHENCKGIYKHDKLNPCVTYRWGSFNDHVTVSKYICVVRKWNPVKTESVLLTVKSHNNVNTLWLGTVLVPRPYLSWRWSYTRTVFRVKICIFSRLETLDICHILITL